MWPDKYFPGTLERQGTRGTAREVCFGSLPHLGLAQPRSGLGVLGWVSGRSCEKGREGRTGRWLLAWPVGA